MIDVVCSAEMYDHSFELTPVDGKGQHKSWVTLRVLQDVGGSSLAIRFDSSEQLLRWIAALKEAGTKLREMNPDA